jgi:hypothetical protein
MTRLRHAVAICAALVMFGASAAVAGIEENPAQNFSEAANFSEIPWPFLLDQWGKGRAFRCAPADCGVEVNVYVRAKIGFCNCLTGVSDDEELDRVGDVSLISETFVPLRGGQPVKVGWMSGRSRSYDAAPRYENKRNVLAVAFNDKCDVVVATVTAQRTVPAIAERAALALLNSGTVLTWARRELGN